MSSAFVPEMYAIDFGTSNSLLAAANRRAVCEPIPLDPDAQDPSVFRSILFFSDDAEWSYGAGAVLLVNGAQWVLADGIHVNQPHSAEGSGQVHARLPVH